MKIKLEEKLKDYLNERKQAARDELRAFGKTLTCDSSTTDRKIRHLTEIGFIEPIVGSKKFNAGYRLKQPTDSNIKFNPKLQKEYEDWCYQQ